MKLSAVFNFCLSRFLGQFVEIRVNSAVKANISGLMLPTLGNAVDAVRFYGHGSVARSLVGQARQSKIRAEHKAQISGSGIGIWRAGLGIQRRDKYVDVVIFQCGDVLGQYTLLLPVVNYL